MRRPRPIEIGMLLPFIGVLMLALAGCVPGRMVYTSGPYRGTVVDAETKKPLAGAVILAILFRETIVLVAAHGPAVDYHDSLEVLADSSGEFVVPEKTHLTPFGRIREPDFVVYYPGYAPYPSLKAEPRGGDVDMAYERKAFSFRLSRLISREERMGLADLPVSSRVPETAIPNLLGLVNKERLDLGLQPIGVPRGEAR